MNKNISTTENFCSDYLVARQKRYAFCECCTVLICPGWICLLVSFQLSPVITRNGNSMAQGGAYSAFDDFGISLQDSGRLSDESSKRHDSDSHLVSVGNTIINVHKTHLQQKHTNLHKYYC